MADEKNVQHTPTSDNSDFSKNTAKPVEPVELGGEELEQRIAPASLTNL